MATTAIRAKSREMQKVIASKPKISDALQFDFFNFKQEEGYRGDLIFPTHRIPFEQITIDIWLDWYFGASNADFEKGYEIVNEDLICEDVEFEFV